MALPRLGQSREVQALPPLDKPQLGKGYSPSALKRWLEAEVISSQRLDQRQTCCLQHHVGSSALVRAVWTACKASNLNVL